MKKNLRRMLLIICLCFFCFFFYKICLYIIEERENRKLNDDLIDIAITEHISNSDDGEKKEKSLPITVDFEALKQQNSDIIAWIYSEDTPINYPIVQTSNNTYYLHRMINNQYNKAGTLFMDYRNNSDFSDNNTIIYGHNLKSNEMFGTITNYKEQSYYEAHKKMYLFTPYKDFIIELLAGYTISSDSDIYNLNSSIEIENNSSTFHSNIDVKEEDKFIILSTCSYEYDEARYILIGILRDV